MGGCRSIAALLMTLAWATSVCGADLPLVDVTTGDQPFPAEQALSGSRSTPELCRAVPDGLWVALAEAVALPAAECIRFYVAGTSEPDSRRGVEEAVVFFAGDAVGGSLEHDGHPATPRLLFPEYAQTTPAGIQRDIARTAAFLHWPLFFVARPGVYGSSGEALKRTTPDEMLLMKGALDQLKARYGIHTFHLYGQSGGGTIVAAMTNLRDDVGCAAMGSGLLDVRQWLTERHATTRGGNTDWYSPVEHLSPNTLKAKIIVVADPRDRYVSYTSQHRYAEALTAAGAQSVEVLVAGHDRAFHDTTWDALQALHMCMKNTPPQEIKRLLEKPGLATMAAQRLHQASAN